MGSGHAKMVPMISAMAAQWLPKFLIQVGTGRRALHSCGVGVVLVVRIEGVGVARLFSARGVSG